jgi:hypothetical protein
MVDSVLVSNLYIVAREVLRDIFTVNEAGIY